MDKVLHAIVGAVIAGTPVSVDKALGLVVVAAVAKEVYDRRSGGKFDGLDALATIAGGAPVIYFRWEF